MRLAQVFLRARKLHPGRPVSHGRSARIERFLRRLRSQLGRYPDLGRPRPRTGRLDARRQGADGFVGQRYPPHVPVPVDAGLHRGTRDRDPGPALRKSLSLPADGNLAQPAPLAAARTPARAQRLFRRSRRLGTPQLVRAARRRAEVRIQLRQAELVRVQRRRTQGRARKGGYVRPEFVFQVPGTGPRRAKRAAARVQRQRRRRARAHGLYPLAQRPWRHRGRPDRDPYRRKRILGYQRLFADDQGPALAEIAYRRG